MEEFILHEQDFSVIQRMLYQDAGISLSPAKRVLVRGRLMKRLRHFGLDNFRDYLGVVQSPQYPEERRLMVDLLTTNETSFFREPRHFQFLTQLLQGRAHAGGWQVWSAACSTGEEPYSIAMTLCEKLGPNGWKVLGSDINSQVLAKAQSGQYPIERAGQIPRELLTRYCMRGTGQAEGLFMIGSSLRQRVAFQRLNLIEALPEQGPFDVIFLRNVMIYFDTDTKRHVIQQLCKRLAPGGHLFVGHSESLQGFSNGLRSVQPAVYRKD